nr:protein yellow-like isoform X1 [Nomia melanderi]
MTLNEATRDWTRRENIINCTIYVNQTSTAPRKIFLSSRSRYRILVILLACSAHAEILETIAQWPLLDFALPYNQEFMNRFRPESVVPTGITVGSDRVFINVPRLRDGVPSTLNYIPRNFPLGGSPQLQAYPSWDWHVAGIGDLNCSRMISVYRSKIDACDRLWVIDSGVITSIDDFRPVCPPKILLFDLATNFLLRMYTFPREVLRPNSLLTNVILDDVGATTCDDVFLYISDTAGAGIVVFDSVNERSWRVAHPYMFPDPDFSTYRIGNSMFELMDGIVGLAFSRRQGVVYFQPLATDRLFSVPTSALQAGPLPFGEQLPVRLLGRKSSQGLALAVDPTDDTVIFAPLTETAIVAWQPDTRLHRIIAQDPEKLQFVAEIRLAERDNGTFWAMSTRFQNFFRREVSAQTINIRIMRLIPDQFIPNTNTLLYGK